MSPNYLMGLLDTVIALSTEDPGVGLLPKLFWIGDETMTSLADGGKPPTISAGSMALGHGWGGTPWGSTGNVAILNLPLDLPKQGCEFGACGSSFQAAGAVVGTIACQIAEPCGAVEDVGAVLVGIGAMIYMSQHGRGDTRDSGVMSDVTTVRLDVE